MTPQQRSTDLRRLESVIARLGPQSPGTAGPFDPGKKLRTLDSLGLVELVLALEKEFSVSFTANLIAAENFSSVDSIIKALQTCGTSVDVHDYLLDGCPAQSEGGTIVDALLHWAATQPDAPFVTWLPASGAVEVLTYGQLERRSRSLTAAISADGELLGRRVGLFAANDIPTVIAMLALLRAGATCLVLDPNDPPARTRSLLAGHSVSAVFRTPLAMGVPADLASPLPGAMAEDGRPWADLPLSAAQPAFMFGTSGSTAASKLVLQSHRSLVSNAEAVREHHDLVPTVKIMGGLPLHHVNGVHFTVMAVLHAGAQLVLPQQFSPLSYRTQIDEHRPHIASVVPTVLEMLLATGRGWHPPESLRYFVTAAAALTSSLAKRVVAASGVRVVQGYGLTETTNFSTTLPVDLSDEDYAALILDAPLPSIGVAVHGNEVAVLSRSGELLGEGEVGEICVRGHNVMEGYADHPGLTAEAFAGGWFHTGDLGCWALGPGLRRFFYLTGRIKNIAKVRGETVSLEELEHALCSVNGVVDAGCVTRPHPLWGEEILAAVTLREASIEEVAHGLEPLVPIKAIPRRWYELPSLPRTPTGKLRRAELLELMDPKGAP